MSTVRFVLSQRETQEVIHALRMEEELYALLGPEKAERLRLLRMTFQYGLDRLETQEG